MGLLDRPQQSQRYGLLSPDVMSLIQSGGPRVPPPAPAQPRRERVSGWRVFDRVLGGQTVTEGLDAERARLQAEADAPRERMMMEREAQIAQEMGGGPGWLAWRANRGELGGNVARQFAPQTLAEGSASVTPGMVNGAPILNERRAVVGDRVVGMGGPGQNPRELLTVQPSYEDETRRQAAETARINALNPVLPANSTWAGPIGGGRQGYIAPNVTNLAPGGEAIITDPDGNVANRVGSSTPRPIPDAIRQANERDDMQISDREATTGRIENVIGLIDNGMLNLGPADRASAWLRNSTNNSSPQSRALVEARRTVETLRNNILNDATGPQTDGDSLRALNQIIDGWGDEQVVREGLAAYVDIQRRKTETQRRIMAQRSAAYSGGQGEAAPGATPAVDAAGAVEDVVNPQTGERLRWNGSAWVRAQ